MAVFSTPGWQEHVHDNTTKTSTNEIFILKAPGEFYLDDWMKILSLVIVGIGLVGNSLVLWLLGFRIKRNPFSVYILNLAGADALFLCCSFLFFILAFVGYSYNSFICLGLMCLRTVSYTVGMNLLAVISTERCLSALFPIWYQCYRPKHTSAIICTVLWAGAGLVWLGFYVLCVDSLTDRICYNSLIALNVWFLFLTCVLCVSSLTLLLRVQCTSQRQQPPRLYLLVLVTVLVFLICGLPVGIVGFMWRFYNIPILLWLPLLLAYVNSGMNPFIYFFLGSQRHRREREALRVVLQRALEDQQELGD
ncbi:mas-related G-protein coupled receptor member X1-like [Macrotis lagotis]|uniref:mas-related G-protein coupled receptor member X1-like n=1 Tax=Macrotis lagotis TaxID=92651 RepID=UPI003D686306